MSTVNPLIDGWVGYGDGSSILLETGTPIDANHPVVLERPELFTQPEKPAAEKPAERPARPSGRAKVSDG
jgi:hypothetical protein